MTYSGTTRIFIPFTAPARHSSIPCVVPVGLTGLHRDRTGSCLRARSASPSVRVRAPLVIRTPAPPATAFVALRPRPDGGAGARARKQHTSASSPPRRALPGSRKAQSPWRRRSALRSPRAEAVATKECASAASLAPRAPSIMLRGSGQALHVPRRRERSGPGALQSGAFRRPHAPLFHSRKRAPAMPRRWDRRSRADHALVCGA